jgi:sugar lactone lactonase YvrE
MTDAKPLRRPDGRQPMFNADGLALSADGKTLYWQALTGKTLYAEKVAETEPVDGLWMGKNGEIYLSSIGGNAIKVLSPDGSIRDLLTDSRLRWPDTFSQGPDGAIYITASHIQDSPWFHMAWTDKSFSLFKFMPDSAGTVGSSRQSDQR